MAELAALVAVVATAIVAHEAAHLVTARLVGHEVFEIQIGGGPAWSRRIADVELRLAPLPLGGHVQTGRVPGTASAGGRRASGAGVAANVALAVAGLVAGSS